MVYTQSRVQRLASFELLAVTNLKATGISSEAIESIRRPTSFLTRNTCFQGIWSFLTCMYPYVYNS